jgi:hypothetical protein
MTLTVIRRSLIVFGVLLPAVETWRRWGQLTELDAAPFWLDDWIIGGLFLLAAWKTRRDPVGQRRWLAAALGFAAGLDYASFFSQLMTVDTVDPSGASGVFVVSVKGALLVLAVAALVIVLRERPPAAS